MKKFLAICLCAAVLCSCSSRSAVIVENEKTSDYNIGCFAAVDSSLTSYEDFTLYAESLDGFVADSTLAASANPLLLKALKDCNIPYAPADTLEALAAVFNHAKRLMDSIVTVDTHCDFPECRYYHPERGYSITESQSRRQVSIEKMRQGHLYAEHMVVWMDPLYDNQKDPRSIAQAPAVMWDFIDKMDSHFAEHSDVCGIARTYEDAVELKKQGRKAFFYALENAYWIGDDLSNLQKLADRGFTYITLSHWGDNLYCHSCDRSEDSSKGLTELGRELVREMNRLGLVIDLSHTSYGTWQDVLSLSKAPVVFTHSGASAVYKHQRNVDDGTLRALAANGGVLQVYIVKSFMGDGRGEGVGLKEMVEHICHAVEVAGIDHVGVGLDFDGGGGGVGFDDAGDAINLTVALLNKGFSDQDIAKIWGGNYFRVLSAVQAMRN